MDRLSVEGRRMEELGEVDVVVVEGRIVMGDNKPRLASRRLSSVSRPRGKSVSTPVPLLFAF